MTEWNVVSVLIALVGLFLTVGAPILKLIESLTKLDLSVQSLKADLDELSAHNTRSHERIFSRLDGQEETLHDHETRIQVMEGKEHDT